MVVYLGEGVDEARAVALAGELRGLPGALRVELVPAPESQRRLVAALGSEPALRAGIDVAALPASVEVTLAPGVRDVIAMSPSVGALRGAPGVADVVVDDPGDGGPAQTLGAARTLAWTGAALYAGLALIVVLAAVRVRLDRGRQELAVAPGRAAAQRSMLAAAIAATAAAISAHVSASSVHSPARGRSTVMRAVRRSDEARPGGITSPRRTRGAGRTGR